MTLDDLVVVDATTGLVGAVACLFLADAGADVVKVEPPGGDPARRLDGFATWNRSRRSVVLDLGRPDDLARLRELLAVADVFLHGLTPAVAGARGLDDAALRDLNPALVVSAITPYPRDSPDSERDGDDLLVEARTGMLDAQIPLGPDPTPAHLPLPSLGAAYLAAIGILARLLARARTGAVGPAHTSLLQGALTGLVTVWNDAERPSARMKVKLPLPRRASPNCFECADGRWVQLNAYFRRVPLVIETLLTIGGTVPEEDDDDPVGVADAFRPAFRQHPADVWIAACRGADVSAQPVRVASELLGDEQVIANGYATELDDDDGRRVRVVGVPWQSTLPSRPPWRAPHVGEHDAELAALLRRSPRSAPPARHGGGSRRLLDGLRVADFGSFVGGPFAPTLLGQLGADVIKVEPRNGDRMRLDDLIWVGTQAGKRVVAMDLKSAHARDARNRVLRWADVVHLNVRAESLASIGLDYESVVEVNPNVVYCHVSGFGLEGPMAQLSAFDPEMQAFVGWLRRRPGGEGFTMIRGAPCDVHGAMLSVIPTLLALLDRERTGSPARIECSILAGALIASTATRATTGVHATSDGWIALAAETDPCAVQKALGTRGEQSTAELLRSLSADDALARLRAGGVRCEAVATDAEERFLHDPDNRRTRLVAVHQHPLYGELAHVGRLWDVGDAELRLDRPAPTLGQHTREVLLELGVPDGQVRLLAAAGVIAGDTLY